MVCKIKEILINELGYSEYAADITERDLLTLQPQLKTALEKWLLDRTLTNIVIGQFSIRQLMLQKGCTFPAALIALDWVLTEPEIAVKELSSDIQR